MIQLLVQIGIFSRWRISWDHHRPRVLTIPQLWCTTKSLWFLIRAPLQAEVSNIKTNSIKWRINSQSRLAFSLISNRSSFKPQLLKMFTLIPLLAISILSITSSKPTSHQPHMGSKWVIQESNSKCNSNISLAWLILAASLLKIKLSITLKVITTLLLTISSKTILKWFLKITWARGITARRLICTPIRQWLLKMTSQAAKTIIRDMINTILIKEREASSMKAWSSFKEMQAIVFTSLKLIPKRSTLLQTSIFKNCSRT